ncbi:MAG: M23 family metallopeptidase [Thermoanaerobaculum sp.]
MRKALLVLAGLALAPKVALALAPGECFTVWKCTWESGDNWATVTCSVLLSYCSYPPPPPEVPIPEGPRPLPPGPPAPWDTNNDGKLDCWRQSVTGYTGNGTCCQQYGVADTSCNPPCNRGHVHTGQDLAAPCGTPVRAPGVGTVYRIWRQGDPNNPPSSTMGNAVQIKLADGTYVVYMHLANIEGWVQPGAATRPGRIIGNVGATGSATGCHLHLQVQTVSDLSAPLSKTIDPKIYFGNC